VDPIAPERTDLSCALNHDACETPLGKRKVDERGASSEKSHQSSKSRSKPSLRSATISGFDGNSPASSRLQAYDSSAARSGSPTPPSTAVSSTHGGNVFTKEDVAYLHDYIRYCREVGEVLR
jgi:hypothetical protein